MKKALAALKTKYRSTAGESIAETLVAVLIAALGMALLATMISASTRLIARSETAIDTYYTDNNTVAAQSGTGVSGSVSVTETTGGAAVKLVPDESSSNVYYYINDTVDGHSVVSYAYQSNNP